MTETDNLQWNALVSSNLDAAAYNKENDTLYVRFKDRSVYAYDGADIALFDGLLDAGSPGSYFAKNIRSLPTRKLT